MVGGPVRQPYAAWVDFIPQSEIYEFGYWFSELSVLTQRWTVNRNTIHILTVQYIMGTDKFKWTDIWAVCNYNWHLWALHNNIPVNCVRFALWSNANEPFADGVHTKPADYEASCKQIKFLFCGSQLSLSLFINCEVKCCYTFFMFFVLYKVQMKR